VPERNEPTPPLSGAELSRSAAKVLDAIPFPALVLETPTERIVAASPAAAKLVDGTGGSIVGHLLEEFTSDRPAAGADLFAGGRLNGFEAFRTIRRPDGADAKVRMWIRSFDGQPADRFVLVVIVAERGSSRTRQTRPEWQDAPAVVGTADAHLMIERVSADAEELFGRPVSALIGDSLLALVAEHDVSRCLSALGDASASQAGITLYLHTRDSDGVASLRCEVLILPLLPAPSCAFVFLPISADESSGNQASDALSAILLRLGRGAEIAQLARGVFAGISERNVPGLHALTTREIEIVIRLLEGDRVPAIAGKLFLSQSTVRNHLASAFAKVGVTSQQALLDKLRAG
jgi:DNA-binding CsgD family transcriptional regulator/PAS domain-containing protein